MPYVGLDVGTSGCKASVVDHAGTILRYAHREYAPVSPKPGYMEMDARIVWQSALAVLRDVAADDITALSIASFGEAVVLLDESDNVLSNSIYYSDIRGSEEVRDILSAMDPAQAQAITGTAANPMYSANKLLWIKKHDAALFKQARRFMLFGDYIGFMLTGERVIDYSLASRTMLFDIRDFCWSQVLSNALDLPVDGFSRPVRTGTPMGVITRRMAQQTGLNKNLLVVTGGHDQALAALGGGALTRGDSVDGMGSSECVSLVIEKGDITPKMAAYNFCCEPYIFENTYLTLAFNASSGTSIRWYRDCFEGCRAIAAKEQNKSIYRIMDEDAPPAPTNLFFLPHVSGSGTPYLDSHMGGALLGLTTSTGKPDIYKAVLEGICYEMQYNVELLNECGLTLDAITAVGGGARSDTLMQIKADVMAREVGTLQTTETGTLALSLLCAYAMGDIPDLKAAVRLAARPGRAYTPNEKNAAIYRERMHMYRRMYPALKNIFTK
ncbi:MAG: hypothetical protein LBS18_07440 [Clostridiales bacterium]|jgi:xylulokinase|nr:hypothetical protein [Clostridiales bacterium]